MVMGEGKNQNFQDYHHHLQSWAAMKEPQKHDLEEEEEEHPCSSIEETSTISNGSSSSSFSCSSSSSFDTTDDASSSADSPNSSRSSLYDLSDLISQLPIKRGLSKFYHGKSDSFTSLARVTSIDDLPKKDNNPYKKEKMKKKSYISHTLPKPIISKKNSRKKKFCSTIMKELK